MWMMEDVFLKKKNKKKKINSCPWLPGLMDSEDKLSSFFFVFFMPGKRSTRREGKHHQSALCLLMRYRAVAPRPHPYAPRQLQPPGMNTALLPPTAARWQLWSPRRGASKLITLSLHQFSPFQDFWMADVISGTNKQQMFLSPLQCLLEWEIPDTACNAPRFNVSVQGLLNK